MKRPPRPPGPPPIRLELQLAGVVGLMVLELDAGPEPECARQIAALADAHVFDGEELRRRKELIEFKDLEIPATWPKVEPRRARHTTHTAGAIGWAWDKVPSDGRGQFYVMVEEERGYDSPYAIVGQVTSGLELLQALPVQPKAALKGWKPPPPVVIETLRRGLS